MRDKQIMIDGVKYNPCNDCELWDGHHCIGARSYEPNANEHKAICNEHMAKQFYKVYQQLYRKTQECESLKEEIEVLKDNFDTATRDCNEIVAELENECEQLKKANQHIDANRQCKGSKLKRIEDLISACEAGYTDEFIQKIYGIIQEPEPTINDYSITDRYSKALEEIEEYCNNVLSFTAVRTTESDILNIINKAKGEECN